MVDLGCLFAGLHVLLGFPLMNSQHFRYWMARFRPIARPQVWMPFLGAGMVSSFVWVAYHSPESFSFSGAAGGSEDSAAIGADIDSVSVLMQEMNDRPTEEAAPDGKTDANKTKATLKADQNSGINSLTQLVKFTPETLNANGMTNLQPNNLPINNLSIGGMPSGSGLNSPTAQTNLFTRNDNGSRISPLTQAIDRMNAQPYSNQGGYPNQSGFVNQNGANSIDNRGGTPIEGTRPLGTGPVWAGIPVSGTSALTTSAPPMSSGTGRSLPGNYDNNAYNTLTGAPAGVALPDPGVAMPLAPNVPIGVPIAPAAGLNSGMVTPFPVSPTETLNVPSEQVFSVPRPVPGRIIGGGTINTFSNP